MKYNVKKQDTFCEKNTPKVLLRNFRSLFECAFWCGEKCYKPCNMAFKKMYTLSSHLVRVGQF